MTCSTYRAHIEAYVDGELPEAGLAELEPHLRTCPSCAAEALGRFQMKRLTQTAGLRYAPALPFQEKLEQRLRAKNRPRWSMFWMPRLAAAACLLALLAFSALFWVQHTERSRELTEWADLHVGTLASTNPVDVVSTDRHTVKPWFAGKLPFTFNLPKLQNSPFQLIGGRLAYVDQSPGAQLLFQLRKHQLSVFISQSKSGESGSRPAAARTLNFNVETWTQQGLRYAVISDTSAADVHQLGELLRQTR